MIIFLKLLTAHIIGDFILQPKGWVVDKEQKRLKSPFLYFHFLVHGFLAGIILWGINLFPLVLSVMLAHAFIDMLKVSIRNPKTKVR